MPIFGTYPLYSVFLKNSGYGTIILQTHRIQVSVKAIRNKKFESSHSLPQNSWVKKLLSMSQQSINNLSLPEIKGTTCDPTETRNKDLTKKESTPITVFYSSIPLHEELHLCCTFHTQLDMLDIPFLGEAVSNYK